ncbi:MAG TPA: twin-arginine translocase subunit TatC [Cellulomonas sp.]
MPLGAHLRELRTRIFRIALGLVVGAVAGWLLYNPAFEMLIKPLRDVAARRDDLVAINFSGLAASLDMQVQVSLFLAVLLTSPWWIYQIWAFVTPGLTRHERRYVVGFLGSAVPLFLVGAVVAWWMLPHAVSILTSFTPAGAQNLIDAPTYLSFVMRLVLAFGLAFLLPVIMVALDLVGVVRSRTWLRAWRWAVVVIFIFAAVATPTPDAVTMLIVAIPMCALYFGAMWICMVHDRRLERRRAQEAAS